jgi:TRAP-type uncharacterized transport system substrate-binding protein
MARERPPRREFIKYTGGTALLGALAGCSQGGGGAGDSDGSGDSGESDGSDGSDGSGSSGGSNGDGQDGSGSDGGSEQPTTEWIISGSNEGSPANAWTQGFAATLEEYSDTLELSPQFVSGWRNATVELDKGTFDLSLYLWLFLMEIENESGPYAEDGKIGPLNKNHQGVTPTVHLSSPFFATFADKDDINTIHDLDGKRVATDVVGSSLMSNLGRIIDAAGVDITWEHMNWSEMGNAIQSKRVDAATPLAINGTTLIGPLAQAFEAVTMKGVQIPTEVTEKTDLEFIDITGDDLAVSSEIDSVRAPANPSGIFTTADKDPDLVYEFVSTVLDHQDELGQYHGALESFGVGEGRHGFTGIPPSLEFHEGAVRYYEEEGIDYPGK